MNRYIKFTGAPSIRRLRKAVDAMVDNMHSELQRELKAHVAETREKFQKNALHSLCLTRPGPKDIFKITLASGWHSSVE